MKAGGEAAAREEKTAKWRRGAYPIGEEGEQRSEIMAKINENSKCRLSAYRRQMWCGAESRRKAAGSIMAKSEAAASKAKSEG
jgi:hypothetical protein